MILTIISFACNVIIAAAIFFTARKAMQVRERKVRSEIALVLQFRSSFAPRKLKKEFRWLADMVIDAKQCEATALEVAKRYRRERELMGAK